MILVTLGTQDKDFDRLLRIIDQAIIDGQIQEKVIVQAGHTKYESENMEIFDLISNEELERLVKKCRLLITHGGVGSILMGIQNHKPIIAAARLKKYKEHTNDHQRQIIKEFENRGYLIALRDFHKFNKVLEKANHFKPKKFVSNTKKFVENVENYIDTTQHVSWWNHFRILSSNGYRGIFLTVIYTFIFYLLCLQHVEWYLNVIISFFACLLFEVGFHFICDIPYQKKNFVLLKILLFILELVGMYIFINIIRYNTMYSICILNIASLIFSVIFIRFLNRGK